MNENRVPVYELLFLISGQLVISAVISAIYLIMDKLTLSVALGALFGGAITVFNFLFLIITTNRAIDRVLAERGEGEMSDEEAAAFAEKHRARLQWVTKRSSIVRLISIAAALILALLLDGVFNVLATVIPLLMLRPLLTLSQLLKTKILRK